MRFVEVAGVSTRLTAFFRTCASQCTASHWQACHYGSRDLAGGARLLSNSSGILAGGAREYLLSNSTLGLSCAPGNAPFWPRGA